MAICCCCGLDMLKTNTCNFSMIRIKDKEYPPVLYGEERRADFGADDGYCRDCGVAKGGYHHPGCNVEECPKCHGQLISCSCHDEEAL